MLKNSTSQNQQREKNIQYKLTSLLFSILGCIAILISSTLALFCEDISSDTSTIEGAYYCLMINKTQTGVYVCPLAKDDTHTFEIKAGGTASTGHCKIQIGEKVYYTPQIDNGEQFSLTITAAENTPVVFTSKWGATIPSSAEIVYTNYIYHSTTPHTLYTVEPTAKLSDIATHYNVSEKDIQTYNGINDVSYGDIIKIPNTSENTLPYAVPYAIYIIEENATIDAVAEYYRVSINDIKMYNNPFEFNVGKEIKIPGVSPDTPPYVMPISEQVESENEGNAPPTESATPTDENIPADSENSNEETSPPLSDENKEEKETTE